MKRVKFCGKFMAATRTPGSDVLTTSGFSKLLQVYPLTVEVQAAIQKEKSFECGSIGQLRASNSYIEDIVATMMVKEEGHKTIQASLKATVTELTGIAGSETTFSVTLSSTVGEYVRIGTYRRVSDVVITGSVLGTDYVVDETLGMIATVLGGNLTAGGATNLAFDYAAEVGGRAEVGTLTTVEWALQGALTDLYNPSDPPRIIEIDAAVIDPTGATAIVAEGPDADATYYEYTLAMRTITGQQGPMRIDGVPFSDF